MSPLALHVKPEEVDTLEKRGKYTTAVIGCGQKGVLYAWLFAEAGFKVICVDADQTLLKLLNKGKAPFINREMEVKLKALVKMGRLTATNNIEEIVSQSDIVMIAINAKIDEKRKADYSEIENTCKQVGSGLIRGSLVIFVGTAGFGFTEGVIKDILENTSGLKAGTDFGLAYSSSGLPDGEPIESLVNQELKIAALEKNSLNSASIILDAITKKGVRKAANVKTAELAALFEAVRRDVNVALANEFAIFCERAGWDYVEVLKFLEADSCGVASCPTLIGENDREEVYLLLEDAESLNAKLRMPAVARDINEKINRHAINLTQNALRSCGKTLRRARIALLGVSKARNIKTSPGMATKVLARMLETKGAKVSLHDPYISESEMAEMPYPFKRNIFEVLEGADCAIILTGHDSFKRLNMRRMKAVMKMPAAIVDFDGIIEPDKVEKEGFIYRGFGRGVWK
jgi:nucleotide sugar dehydrogenase